MSDERRIDHVEGRVSGFNNLSGRVSHFSRNFIDRRLSGSRSVRLDRAKAELRKLFHRAKNQPTF